VISVCGAACAYAGVANRALERGHVAGPVGKDGGSGIERDDEGFVIRVKNAMQKFRGGLLFGADHIRFAAAGVDEKADGERQSFLAREEGNFLFDVVLENSEIILIEVRDDGFLFVENGGVKIYERDTDANSLALRRRWRVGPIYRKGERARRE